MYALDELLHDPRRREALQRSLLTLEPEELRCVKIKLTSRCNLRCQMCKYWKTEQETTLSTDQWRRVLDEMAGLGCRKVHFSGGEVFLRPDFLDLVEHAAGAGMKVNMTTNGTLLTKERVDRLARARPNSISLSLDGPRPRVHDRIRGLPGSFRRTTRAIRRLRAADRPPKIRVNFVLMRANFRHAPEMVDLARSLGAVEIHPMPVDEKGEPRNRLSRAQIRRYNEEIAPQVLQKRREHGFSTHPDLVYPFGVSDEDLRQARDGLYARGFYAQKACLAPWLHLFVAWDGESYLCCMTNGRMESLGNVNTEGVRAVFHGERMRTVRRAFLNGKPHPACHRCDMFLAENRKLHAALG